MNHRRSLMALLMLVLVLIGLSGAGWAAPVSQQACDTPLPGVELCWNVTGDEGSPYSPYPEVQLLALAQERNGQPELLEEYSRMIYRQLLPGAFARRLVLVWEPVTNLEGAMDFAWRGSYPLVLYIAPRALRNSSGTTAGLVDWDVFLVNGGSGRLERSIRIRVESKPVEMSSDAMRKAALTAGLLSFGLLPDMLKAAHPLGLGGAVGVAGLLGEQTQPNRPGWPLPILTELAVRQIMYVSQSPMEELAPTPVVNRTSAPPSQGSEAHNPMARIGNEIMDR